MPETRKDAPLPPLPRRLENAPGGPIIWGDDGEVVVILNDQPKHHAVADLLLRAPVLKAEVARLRMEHEDICRENREVRERNEYVEQCASELVKRVDEAKADLAAKAALLRELAAAAGMVDTAYRKLRVVEDAAGTYYSIPVSEFDRLGKAIVGLRSVPRRAEAEAGEGEMRDITCPADLDRLPACPSCQQLSRDLAAALQRAEKAEKDALQAFEDHQGVCQVVLQLREDLAAARRERDALREALAEWVAAEDHEDATGSAWAAIHREEGPAEEQAHKEFTEARERLVTARTAARAALEKANG